MAAMEKNNKTLNVPNLRFPEFSGEWEKTRFENVVSLQRGSSPRPIIEYITKSSDGVNWVKIGDMPKYGRLVTSTEEKITKEGAKKSRRVNVGDLILSNSMSYGQPYIMNIDGYIHDGWFVLKNFEKSFDRDYLCNLLISPAVQNQYRRLAAGGVVQNISSDLVNSVIISLPSIKEQQKIASVLNIIDDRIATQRKIIEDLKKLKRAICKIVFSSPECVTRKMADMATITMGQSPSSLSYNEDRQGLPLIQGNLDLYDGQIRPRIYTSEITQTCTKGDVILTVRAPVGEIAHAQLAACIGRGVCAISPHNSSDAELIYQYLSYYKPTWAKLEQGSTFSSINGADIRGIEVRCPSMSKIVLLQLFDTRIQESINLLNAYSVSKCYLLSQLFI